MQTFDKQSQVRSIDEMLESTLYVQAKNAEIERLQAEIQRLTTAGLNAAYGETIKADEANDYYAEAANLHIELGEAQERILNLEAALAEIESICQTQSDNLQRYAASELEHNRRYTDLRTKLDAANAELHELRIKSRKRRSGEPQRRMK